MVNPPRKSSKAKPAEPVQFSEQAEVLEQDAETLSSEEQTQVNDALQRETHDGPGDDPVPPANFESYATEGVQKENKSLQVVVQEVLDGKWGDHKIRRQRLQDAGYNPSEVQHLANMRISGGAPSSHKPTVEELNDQIQQGEWGSNNVEIRRNLDRAGHRLWELTLPVEDE